MTSVRQAEANSADRDKLGLTALRSVPALYALAIFSSSCLLFLVEPMSAKRLVPLLGGSAAVWTTCLVFFQTTLLLGYALAHWLVTHLSISRQALAYLSILLIGLLFSLDVDRQLHPALLHPVTSVLLLLTSMIGVPFLALSASGPLLQAWYARSQARGSVLRPPYRLFALSNFGSLVALASYPIFIEPRATLHIQGVAWSCGLALYAMICVAIAWRIRGAAVPPVARVSSPGSRPEAAQVVLWIALAACGSVLLCAVTGYLSQNIAAIPLLWVVPLTAYLLSFMLTFQGWRRYPRTLVLLLLAAALGALGYLLWIGESNLDLYISIPLFCVALLVSCTFAHGEVYRLRPAAQHSTLFYLCIAAGGAIGAFFVAIVAPHVFAGDYEFCLALLMTAVLALIVTWRQAFAWRALWLTATLALCAITFKYVHDYRAQSIVTTRNFYGALRVTEQANESGPGLIRDLYNGTIEHGTQWLQGSMRYTPTTYYAADSGAGLALNLCCPGTARRVGVIGLGTGTLAAYGRAGDVFRFYEINPLVEQIARRQFSYLSDSRARIEIVPGDARISLTREPQQNYDVLLIDAFSGDAIPVHLLTAQALSLYLRHLRPNGIIAFHVSNRYLDLQMVVQQQAEHAGLRTAFIETDDNDSRGEYGAAWVLVTNNQSFLAQPAVRTHTSKIVMARGLRLWTDDYSSLLPLLRWGD